MSEAVRSLIEAISSSDNAAATLNAALPEFTKLGMTGTTLNGSTGNCSYCATAAAALPALKLLTCARCKSAYYCNVSNGSFHLTRFIRMQHFSGALSVPELSRLLHHRLVVLVAAQQPASCSQFWGAGNLPKGPLANTQRAVQGKDQHRRRNWLTAFQARSPQCGEFAAFSKNRRTLHFLLLHRRHPFREQLVAICHCPARKHGGGHQQVEKQAAADCAAQIC